MSPGREHAHGLLLRAGLAAGLLWAAPAWGQGGGVPPANVPEAEEGQTTTTPEGTPVTVPVSRPKPAGGTPAAPLPSQTVEGYLERHGLKAILAEQLSVRLGETSGEERAGIADRLGRLYVELLGQARDRAEREFWEARARELLAKVPDAQSGALRVDLLRSAYDGAEQAAERWRLRLVGEAERAETERTLGQLRKQLENLGTDFDRRARNLENALASDRADARMEEEFSETKRLRQVCFYYAGWAAVYQSLLSGGEGFGEQGLKSFGWLTGRPGNQVAVLERLPKAMLKHEHIARSAVGAAMCLALKGDDAEAIRWLDAIEGEAVTPAVVKAQALPWRLTALAKAARWADIDRAVRKVRGSGENARPLPAEVARLLAVLCLSSTARSPTQMALAKLALEDLIAQDQSAQVIDLAGIFPGAELGDRGFIAFYIKGTRTFRGAMERLAREAGLPADAEPTEPARDVGTINAFRQAADLLDQAVTQPDVPAGEQETLRVLIAAGRAAFYAGDFVRAGERFSSAFEKVRKSPGASGAEDALWLAIVALTRAAGPTPGAQPAQEQRLEELSTLFVRTFPSSPRAARLVLDMRSRSAVADEEAVRVLLAVPKSLPVYEESRRRAASLLYGMFRAAGSADRQFASQRYVAVAEDVLAMDRQAATAEDRQAAGAAFGRLVTTARQLLDALLSVSPTDVARARGVLDTLTAVATYNSADLSAWQDELEYRRFQLALAQGEQAAAESLADSLEARVKAGGTQAAMDLSGNSRWAISARRVLYLNAAERFARLIDPAQVDRRLAAAKDVVRHGRVVIEQLGLAGAPPREAGAVRLFSDVAAAAELIFQREQDTVARDLAISLDRAVALVSPGNPGTLARLAALSEAAGDAATALDAWRQLSSGLPEGTPPWFQARYHAIRLLAERDVRTADTLMAQHVALYPQYGPGEWADLFRALQREIRSKVAGLSPAAGGAPAGGGS